MKLNYILVYGIPYIRTKYFSSFKTMSSFIVARGVTDYIIFEPMSDEKELSLILGKKVSITDTSKEVFFYE